MWPPLVAQNRGGARHGHAFCPFIVHCLGYSPFGQVFLKHSDHNHWSPADGSASALEQLGNLMPYQYTEATTGLVHLDARWHNPQTQRFVQPNLWNFRNAVLAMV